MTVSPEMIANSADGIKRAAQILRDGGLLGLPTETVYGLAADARDEGAVARIFAAKGRPNFNPLIVHVADLTAAETYAVFNDNAAALAQAFWPGPLTLVLPLKPGHGLSPAVNAGLPHLAVRAPAHPAAQAVLMEFAGPVAAPSANPSGRISPTSPEHVRQGLGTRIDAILDAGPCEVGVESTILAMTGDAPRLLREGGLPREALERMIGPISAGSQTPAKIEAPGQLSSHYAPRTRLRMNVRQREPGGSVLIGFGSDGASDLNLSLAGDLREAASRLFALLHEADDLAQARGVHLIEVTPVPDHGIGRAVNDRLKRASAERT